MPQIHVLYTPLQVQYQGTGLDALAVLGRLRAIVGIELAAGWSLINSLPVSGSSGSWLVTLEHDLDNICVAVRECVAWTADPEFKLWQDEAASSKATVTIEAPRMTMPEPEPEPEPELEPEREVEQDPLRLPLPLEIPPILLGSEAGQRARAAVFGVLIGIALAAALGELVPYGNPIRTIFNPITPSAILTTVILCLFFWGLLLGLNRRRRLAAIARMNDVNLLSAMVVGLHSHGVAGLDEALKEDVVSYSPLLRRVRVLLEQWILKPSLQNANLALQPQIISSHLEAQRVYLLPKILACATAVLGLIGLTGAPPFSFLVLAEGLLSSLILLLVTFGLQSREEQLYAGIERSLAEEFLPALQRAAPEQEPQSSDLWAASITETTRKVMEVIDAAGQKLMASWDERHKSYLAELQSVQKATEQSSLSIVQTLENGTSAIGFQLAQAINTQKALLEKILEESQQGLQAHGSDLKEATQAVVASLQQSSGEISGRIKSVVGALDESAEKHRNMTQQAFIESSQALAEYSGETIRAATALHDLSKITEQVLQSQATLQSAMAKLGDSKLADLMTELDATLKDLKPAIANLSQPFVLQAVPVRGNQP
ncbi:MAG: hypothetical protein WCF54_17545 [Terracidiphilus sp.]